MGDFIDAPSLYNLLNQGVTTTSTYDPYNVLLFDVREREKYELSHIPRALFLKEKKNHEFSLPFDCHPEMRWHICIYDEDSMHLDIYGRLAKIIKFLILNHTFTNVRILRGGFRLFTKKYPFMSTKKLLYLPKELERFEYYPLDIIHEFLYLALPMHKLPKHVIENLHITAKVVCFPKTFEKNKDSESLTALYPEVHPIGPKSILKFIEAAFEFMCDQSEQGGRVVIVTNDFSRVGTTLAMAYLIGREGKNVMEAWKTMRKAYLALRPRWDFLDQLALFEQKIKKLDEPNTFPDQDFL